MATGDLVTKVKRSAQIAGVTIGGVDQTVETKGEMIYQEIIPANTTDREIDFAFDISKIALMACVADQDGVVLKTNSASVPDDTVNLSGNSEKIWYSGDTADTQFITHTTTKLYVSTGSKATKVIFGVAFSPLP